MSNSRSDRAHTNRDRQIDMRLSCMWPVAPCDKMIKCGTKSLHFKMHFFITILQARVSLKNIAKRGEKAAKIANDDDDDDYSLFL